MSIKRFKECRMCGKTEPRGWTEADLFKCEECKADTREALRMATSPRAAAQMQALKAAQYKDPRAAQLARAMANDALGTQQDLGVDSVLAILTYDRAEWDSSSHRQYEASSVASVSSCDDSGSSYHHTSHDSGSSYDSGSDSSSYTSGGCD